PVGGSRHGVLRAADFFAAKTGRPDGRLSTDEWLTVPEFSLAEAVNGEIFRDDAGDFTRVRKGLAYLPEDVRRKKLAGRLLLMAQAGPYNYPRCVKRGETGAAQLAVGEFVASAMHAVFLLNRRYLPYYKWQFRALREMPLLAETAEPLERFLSTGNGGALAAEKEGWMAAVADGIQAALVAEGLLAEKTELERAAYRVNDKVGDSELRNRHILCGV
ncbi:MAG: DUF4037 domain-containing protein, partial [Clostridia bacterium]|nr:DUF4037 domain-containing protein [Clostridia bacterium]